MNTEANMAATPFDIHADTRHKCAVSTVPKKRAISTRYLLVAALERLPKPTLHHAYQLVNRKLEHKVDQAKLSGFCAAMATGPDELRTALCEILRPSVREQLDDSHFEVPDASVVFPDAECHEAMMAVERATASQQTPI